MYMQLGQVLPQALAKHSDVQTSKVVLCTNLVQLHTITQQCTPQLFKVLFKQLMILRVLHSGSILRSVTAARPITWSATVNR